MLRALTLAALFAVLPGAASGQALGVLHIKVTLTDAARASMPVPRHALLISDNPATSSPRRVVTAPDGTADVRLRSGKLHRGVGRAARIRRQGLSMDADGRHLGRTRRGPRTDRRERGGRSRTGSIVVPSADGERPVAPPAAMEGQRRRHLDAGLARVGIRRRCRRASS